MVKIEIQQLQNGFVKKSIDTNHNGANINAELNKVFVYPKTIDDIQFFVEDILNDLGLSLDYGDEKVEILTTVSKDMSVDDAIKYHKSEIRKLEKLKNGL